MKYSRTMRSDLAKCIGIHTTYRLTATRQQIAKLKLEKMMNSDEEQNSLRMT